MRAEQQILQRLEAEQTRLAKESLEQPGGRDAFEYGRAVGMHAGLEHAKRTLLEMFADTEKSRYEL